MFLLVKLHIDMGLEAVLPVPQNALYVMLWKHRGYTAEVWNLGTFCLIRHIYFIFFAVVSGVLCKHKQVSVFE